MAFTQTDLDNVNAAIASGELRVRSSNGSEVSYRSIEELLKARAMIEADLAANVGSGTGGVARRGSYRVNFTTGRGF
ncbi:MAG: hypothetical protein WBC18_07880 [Ottowia sp.]|uniref:phage head-tail joining protein n=1 Tax=Ottowia sp. TaxID=1898956 RepID=UPI003C73AEEE